MRKKPVISLVGVMAVFALGAWGFSRFSGTDHPASAAPPPASAIVPVTVDVATRRDVPLYLEALGTVQGFQTVTIRPQVDGQLREIAFKEGQEVHAGDLLAQIDPRTYQAALDQAMAKKAQDEALLANARNDLQRYTGLVEKNYIARQQLDNTRTQVNQLEAAVQGDQASIENARVLLGYTTIKAPIDGRVGIRNVDVGNVVRASDATGIVVITQTRPISVLFTLPEEDLQKVVEAMAATQLRVEAVSRDGKKLLDQGVLELVDNQIDQNTGTVRLKATMPNKKGLLWPGQFLNVKLRLQIVRQAVTVPGEAIQRGPDGPFAFVVKNDRTAEARPLTVAAVSDGVAVIGEGLADGETVVTAGQYRLQTGTKVEAKAAPEAPQPKTAP